MRRSVAQPRRARRAFTLTELMVAVLVLLVVIIATSKIFGTASNVTGLGQAGAAVLQEASAIERQMRTDIEHLSREGFFAIRCVAVPNNVNAPGPLVNPSLPPNAVIRADQLVFFTQRTQSLGTMTGGVGMQRRGQGSVARVYYGHGFQLPNAPAVEPDPDNELVLALDPVLDLMDPIVPWDVSPPLRDLQRIKYAQNPDEDYLSGGPGPSVDVTQPIASKWVLLRHAVVLADDDVPDVGMFEPSRFLKGGGGRSARSIFVKPEPGVFTPEILNGRVDAAASQLNEVRLAVLDFNSDLVPDPWLVNSGDSQQSTIGSAVFYPRAERIPPGMHRVDQALTNNVIASACSSFIVDWTYEDGVGAAVGGGQSYVGVPMFSDLEQVWFGLPDSFRGVREFREYFNTQIFAQPHALFPVSIERYDQTPRTATGAAIEATSPNSGAQITVYEALFGFNQDEPLNGAGNPWSALPPEDAMAYTPWPTAIRVTMTLHDPEQRLEAGRQVQFVIDLPRRN